MKFSGDSVGQHNRPGVTADNLMLVTAPDCGRNCVGMVPAKLPRWAISFSASASLDPLSNCLQYWLAHSGIFQATDLRVVIVTP